jgi:O-antigen/teichoic acid export membrane protein
VGPPPSRGRAWLLLVGGDVAYRVLAAVFWLVLARALDARSLGDVALATALSVPALVVLDGGLAQYLVREVGVDDGGRVPVALRPALRRRALALVVLPVLVGGATVALGATADRFWIGLLVGASLSFEGAAQAWMAGPAARGDMRPDAAFRATYGAVTVALAGALWAAGELYGVTAAAATAGAALVAAALSARHLPSGGRWSDRPVGDPRARNRFLTMTLLVTAFASADVVIVAALLGSAVLAPYALAVKVMQAQRILPVATARVSLTWARIAAEPRAADEVRAAARAGLALALAGVIAGPWLASVLFGRAYEDEMLEPLRILSLTLVPFAIRAPLTGRHLGAGDAGVAARCAAVVLAVGLVALPLGTMALDTTGTALAVLLAEIAGTLVFVRRRAADGWSLRDAAPGPARAVLLAAALVAGLLLPPFSALVLVPAAAAALLSLEGRPRGYRHLHGRTA